MKIKISENTGPHGLYFSGKLHKSSLGVLGYFSVLLRLPLDARSEVTNHMFDVRNVGSFLCEIFLLISFQFPNIDSLDLGCKHFFPSIKLGVKKY